MVTIHTTDGEEWPWNEDSLIHPSSIDHLHDYISKEQSIVFKKNGNKVIYNTRNIIMIEITEVPKESVALVRNTLIWSNNVTVWDLIDLASPNCRIRRLTWGVINNHGMKEGLSYLIKVGGNKELLESWEIPDNADTYTILKRRATPS